MSVNVYPGVCVACNRKVPAGHGERKRAPSGAWIVDCAASRGSATPPQGSPRPAPPVADAAALAAALASVARITSERDAARAEVATLRAALASHALPEAVVRALAERAGRAVVDSILAGALELRRTGPLPGVSDAPALPALPWPALAPGATRAPVDLDDSPTPSGGTPLPEAPQAPQDTSPLPPPPAPSSGGAAGVLARLRAARGK